MPSPLPPGPPLVPRAGRAAWIVSLCLLALAASYFAFRGPGRVRADGASDFALIHAATVTWVRGGNPYDAEAVGAAWTGAGGSVAVNPAKRGDKDLLYPPSAFLILSPLALLGPHAGLVAWTILSIAAALLAASVAAQLAGVGRREPGYWLIIAAMLALAPGHTNFNVGQTAHIVLGFIAAAYAARAWKPERGGGGDIACGVLLGVAAALKPQVGLPFLALELACARWATVLAGGATGALLLALGGARLWLADIDWISAWRSNLAAFKQSGAGNPAPPNEWRYQIISLHYPLRAFIPNATVVKSLVVLICAALAACFWVLRRQCHGLSRRASRERASKHGLPSGPSHGASTQTSPGPGLLDISMAAVLGLLLFYHRFYDAVVLIFPAALGIALLARGRRVEAICLLLPLAVFLVPGAAVLHKAQTDWHAIPPWLAESLLFQGVIMPHQPWAILTLACVLTWLARRLR